MKIIFLSCLLYSMMLIQQNSVSAQSSNGHFAAIISLSSSTATISEFNCSIKNDRIFLQWVISNNQAANQFEVESSTDGKNFVMAALVFTTEKKNKEEYQFFEKVKKRKTFYRLKVINKDHSVTYSAIVTPETAGPIHL